MDKMMDDGGLATDGTKVDPISGNEVPTGSNAEEVRDDVDAKLSEGEYVVPADVVRYFGVGYFEKLRKKAKESLAEMDAEGRVGGEPVAPTAEDTLSDEEMDELTEVLNMAKGGYVKGYNTGGLETDIDPNKVADDFMRKASVPETDWRQYSTPGSFASGLGASNANQNQQQESIPATASFVEYIGPNGQIMMVPVDAEGNPTIDVPEGYKIKTANSARIEDDNSDDHTMRDTERRARDLAAQRDSDWFDSFHAAEDPFEMAKALLAEPEGKSTVVGKVIGGMQDLNDISRIRGYAAAIQETNPDLAKSLTDLIDETIAGAGFGIQALESILGNGKAHAAQFSELLSNAAPESTTSASGRTSTTADLFSDTTVQQQKDFREKSIQAAQLAEQERERARNRASSSNRDDSDDHMSAVDRHREIFDRTRDAGHSAGVAASTAAKTITVDLSDNERQGGAELDRVYGISGLAKGGLVKRPDTKKAKAPSKAKPKTSKNKKKGLGRK